MSSKDHTLLATTHKESPTTERPLLLFSNSIAAPWTIPVAASSSSLRFISSTAQERHIMEMWLLPQCFDSPIFRYIHKAMLQYYLSEP